MFIYPNSYFSDKGLVSIQGKAHQVIVQGVHELYDLEETAVEWKEDEKRTNRLVLIGKNKLCISLCKFKELFLSAGGPGTCPVKSNQPKLARIIAVRGCSI